MIPCIMKYITNTDRHTNIHIAGFLKIMLCSSKMASNRMGQMGQIVQMSQIGQMGQFDREKVMAGWGAGWFWLSIKIRLSRSIFPRPMMMY